MGGQPIAQPTDKFAFHAAIMADQGQAASLPRWIATFVGSRYDGARQLARYVEPIIMLRRSFIFALFTIVSGFLSVEAQEPKAKAPAAKKAAPNPAYTPVQDIAGLPRVLIIGDSISIGYQVPLREALKAKANVHRPPTNCGPTSRGVEQIDAWLGDGKWDVIHFNFGLHDVRHQPAARLPRAGRVGPSRIGRAVRGRRSRSSRGLGRRRGLELMGHTP